MRVYYDLEGLPSFKNAVITTGSFDGVHAGHQKILSQIRHLTNQFQGESVVITFDPHPRQVIYPKDNTLRLLTSTKEKLKYLEQYGVDNAIVLPFTIEFSQQPAREYIEKFLIGKFDPACLVVGYDHRFGLNREGSFELLKEYADRAHFDLVKIEKQDIEEITVSSTKIRQAISEGQIDNANTLLGHPYILSGEVVHGEKIGSSIGFPTANILIDNPIKLLPPEGIYAVRANSHYGVHDGMLYIGTRPTVQQKDPTKRIEVNLFDFHEDLYEKRIELELVAFIREDKALSDLTELKKAIAADKEAVLEILGRQVSKQHPKNTTGVVALNYNGSAILPDYLPSVVKYTPQHDIVLADNASTDASVEYVEQHFPRVKITRMTKNTGYAGGYNVALSQLDYDYFALINTDIEVTKNWLEPLIEFLDSNPDVGAVQPKILSVIDRTKFEYAGGAGGFIDWLGYPFCRGRVLDTIEDDIGQYNDGSDIFWASGAAFVVRSDIFKNLGGFDNTYFAHMEEIDLCWRIQRAGYRICYVPESTVYHLGGATLTYNSPKKIYLNFRNNIKTLLKNRDTPSLLVIIPMRLVLDVLAAFHFLVKGQFGSAVAVVHAYVSVILSIPQQFRTAKAQRQNIESNKHGQTLIRGVMRKSMLIQYYFHGRKKFSLLNGITHGKK